MLAADAVTAESSCPHTGPEHNRLLRTHVGAHLSELVSKSRLTRSADARVESERRPLQPWHRLVFQAVSDDVTEQILGEQHLAALLSACPLQTVLQTWVNVQLSHITVVRGSCSQGHLPASLPRTQTNEDVFLFGFVSSAISDALKAANALGREVKILLCKGVNGVFLSCVGCSLFVPSRL